MRTMEINLPLGEIIIGRGPECYLRVDEPMVSRRHARLRVTPTAVSLEDLGSRNGSRVNGTNATGVVTLNPGDILGVGTQQFTLEREDDPSPHRPTVNYTPLLNVTQAGPTGQSGQSGVSGMSSQPGQSDPGGPSVSVSQNPDTASSINPVSVSQISSISNNPMTNPGGPNFGLPHGVSSGDVSLPAAEPPTHLGHSESDSSDGGQSQARGSAYRLFWGLSDKVLNMGRIEEAERMMGPRLAEMQSRAKNNDIPEEGVITEALRRALKLAAATKKDQWFAWIFEYASLCKYKMPLPLLDEIYAQVFVCRPAIGAKIAAYQQTIDEEVIVVRLATLRRLCRE